ncbi:hypothetical protein [Pontibacter saemangeumensis]|uniref:hypothetical protein n=1 Tax=Pontibacter saemangeumensis TaxID=1084525 RepID=UPI0031E67086
MGKSLHRYDGPRAPAFVLPGYSGAAPVIPIPLSASPFKVTLDSGFKLGLSAGIHNDIGHVSPTMQHPDPLLAKWQGSMPPHFVRIYRCLPAYYHTLKTSFHSYSKNAAPSQAKEGSQIYGMPVLATPYMLFICRPGLPAVHVLRPAVQVLPWSCYRVKRTESKRAKEKLTLA